MPIFDPATDPATAAAYEKAAAMAPHKREALIYFDMAAAAEVNNRPEVERLQKELDGLRRGIANGEVGLWDLQEILDFEPDPKDELWDNGVLYAGEHAAIVGAPGTGKSRLAMQAAICTIVGMPFLGWKTNGAMRPWLFLQTENSARRLKHDLSRMLKGLPKGEIDLLSQYLKIFSVEKDARGTTYLNGNESSMERLSELVYELDPAVVVQDPLRDATTGDLNSDAEMSEALANIRRLVRGTNPKRTPLLVHHGRTGSMEASKVFGDDANSFGRNSKVLNGWLRSQINVAPAGVEHEGIIIIGCGKCSNSQLWKPFAAELNEESMMYERLEPADFDLDAWKGDRSGPGKASSKPKPSVEDAVRVMENGCRRSAWVSAIKDELGISQSKAYDLIEQALRRKKVRMQGQNIFTNES